MEVVDGWSADVVVGVLALGEELFEVGGVGKAADVFGGEAGGVGFFPFRPLASYIAFDLIGCDSGTPEKIGWESFHAYIVAS